MIISHDIVIKRNAAPLSCFTCESEFTRAGNFQTEDSDFRLIGSIFQRLSFCFLAAREWSDRQANEWSEFKPLEKLVLDKHLTYCPPNEYVVARLCLSLVTMLSINKWTQPRKLVGVFQNLGVCGQAVPSFLSPTPFLPPFCSRPNFRAAIMWKTPVLFALYGKACYAEDLKFQSCRHLVKLMNYMYIVSL